MSGVSVILIFMGNFEKIGVAGDWHADALWASVVLDQFARNGITHILQAGDFGLYPDTDTWFYLTVVQDSLLRNNQTLYVTLGNHENYVYAASLSPHPEMEGFVYDPTYPNILVATRGARWVWEDVSFVSLGGAASINFPDLTKDINWWEEERITLGDVYRTVEGGHADVMITHDAPAGVTILGSHREDKVRWSPEGLAYANQSRETVRSAVDGVKPDLHFHGHYHRFLDSQLTFNDGLEDYSFRSISLDQNRRANHFVALELPSLKVTVLKMQGEA